MWTEQSNFTKGEIDPQLAGRSDTELYFAGVETARNVQLIPQGGLRVRYGSEYIATAVNGRLESFVASDGTEYLLLFDDAKMYVYKNDALVTNINGSGNSYLVIPHTSAQVVDMDYVQYEDTMFMLHEDVETIKILCDGDATWTIAYLTDFATHIPTYDFNDSYSPSGTAEIQTLTFVQANSTDRFKISIYGILTDDIAYAGHATADQYDGSARNMQEALENHPLFKGKSVVVAWSSGSIYTVTMDQGLPYPIGIVSVVAVYTQSTSFRCTSAITTAGVARAEYVWSEDLAFSITGATTANPCVITCTGHTFNNGDRIIITGVGGMTQLNGNSYVVEGKTANTFQLSGINSTAYAVYTSGGSATRHGRGWPRTGCFHEGRLYFGGAKELQQTVWGSNVNDVFNFRAGSGLDDQAVTFSIASNNSQKINAIFSNGALQVFTTYHEYYVPVSPVTPETVAAKIQTSNGSKRIHPINMHGQTVYAQLSGKSINSFEYVNDTQSNRSLSVSLLSPHLIKNPVHMVLRPGSTTLDATYIYIVNTDGTVTILNSLPAENIAAFTRWETDGLIKSVSVLGDNLYSLVARTIGGSTVYYIEKENSELATDCAVRSSGLASATLTGLTHLNGETVKVRALSTEDIADGYTSGGATLSDEVVAVGSITVSRAFDTIEAGLDYSVTITTMPLSIGTDSGKYSFKKKRIMKCGIDLYQSNGVLINGEEINDRVIGQSQFSAPQPFTGKKTISLAGWSYDAQVTITRGSPHIFQILNIGLEVKL